MYGQCAAPDKVREITENGVRSLRAQIVYTHYRKKQTSVKIRLTLLD